MNVTRLSLASLMSCCLLLASAAAQSSWTAQNSGSPEAISGVARGAGGYVAVGDGGTILSSPNAVAWTARSSGSTVALRSIAYQGNQFVAVGAAGTILTSPNGTSWTSRSSGSAAFLSGIAFAAGKHVVVGEFGTVLTSVDAVTWTARSSGTSAFLQAVAAGPAGLVTAGSGGTILRSADGIAWTVASSGTGVFLTAAAWHQDRFIVAGQLGTILTSPAGSTWTAQSSGTIELLRGLGGGSGIVLVVGDAGTILSSRDGVAWSAQTSGSGASLSAAGNFAEPFVVVGDLGGGATKGTILTAPLDPGFRFAATIAVGSEGGPALALPIERVGATGGAASVDVVLSPGTATPGADYGDVSGTVEFAPGQSAAMLAVPLPDDAAFEGVELFTAALVNPSSGHMVYLPSVLTAIISDDDDSDLDGLLDSWEVQYFGSVFAQNGVGNPDGDGNDNAREFADGTDPTDADSARYRLTTAVVGGGSVERAPDQASYDSGTVVSLSAQPAGAFVFAAWSGAASGVSPDTAVTMSADRTVTATFTLPLAAALDNDCVEWLSSGGSAWEGQGAISSDGEDAASAPGPGFGESSTLHATVHGPLTIAFQWKFSASNFDAFVFSIDGNTRATLNGAVDWQAKSYFIGAGTHSVTWSFRKNFSGASGLNRAFVDAVEFSLSYADWQSVYFTSAERADPLISGRDADPEGDAYSNFFEFALGSQPRVDEFGTIAPVIAGVPDTQAGSHAGILFTRPKALRGALSWQLESSETLAPGSWQVLNGASEEIVGDAAMVETVRLVDPSALAAQPRRFYRLKVSELLP